MNPCIFGFSALVYLSTARFGSATNDTTANTTDVGICSNHCSQQDPDLTCWNKTEHYYDVNMINALNDWMIVQINIAWWNQQHEYPIPPPQANETTIARLAENLPSGSILDLTRLQEIIPPLLDAVYTHASDVPPSGIGMPEFVCPIPCDYDSRLWEYLFIASLLVNIAMLLVVIPFIVKSERRDKKLYAKQVSMMQMLKPTSKSRNPSSS